MIISKQQQTLQYARIHIDWQFVKEVATNNCEFPSVLVREKKKSIRMVPRPPLFYVRIFPFANQIHFEINIRFIYYVHFDFSIRVPPMHQIDANTLCWGKLK